MTAKPQSHFGTFAGGFSCTHTLYGSAFNPPATNPIGYYGLPSQFADHHDITHFYEVSAKTGENVTESFEAFFRDVHRKVSTQYNSLFHY